MEVALGPAGVRFGWLLPRSGFLGQAWMVKSALRLAGVPICTW